MREAGEDEPAVARPEGLIRADVGVTGPERLVVRAERQHVGGDVGEGREDGLEHGELDALPAARTLALEERAENAVGGVDAARDVGDGRRGLDRRAAPPPPSPPQPPPPPPPQGHARRPAGGGGGGAGGGPAGTAPGGSRAPRG